jgi:multiple sugar transport system substrate-binding protein
MPPGTNTYGWNENNKAFRDGQVAFYLDYNGFYGANQDPEQSKVAGKFKVAPPYSGPAKPFAMGAFHSYSMTKCAEDKGVADAAASFIMFMTSDEITFVENNEGGTLPVRQAVASMLAEAAEGDPAKQAFWQAAGETGSMASDWGIWHDPNWGQHADIIAPFLEKALIGELTAQEALDQADQAVIKSLDDIGLLHK